MRTEPQHSEAERRCQRVPIPVAGDRDLPGVIEAAIQLQHEAVTDEEVDTTDAWNGVLTACEDAELGEPPAHERLEPAVSTIVRKIDDRGETPGQPSAQESQLTRAEKALPEGRLERDEEALLPLAAGHLGKGLGQGHAQSITALVRISAVPVQRWPAPVVLRSMMRTVDVDVQRAALQDPEAVAGRRRYAGEPSIVLQRVPCDVGCPRIDVEPRTQPDQLHPANGGAKTRAADSTLVELGGARNSSCGAKC